MNAEVNKAKKKKIAISIDPDLYYEITSFIEETNRGGGVSGVLEECAKAWFPMLRACEASWLTGEGEIGRLEAEIGLLEWKRSALLRRGQYEGEFEDEIEELRREIMIEEHDISQQVAFDRAADEARAKQKKTRKTGKKGSKND